MLRHLSFSLLPATCLLCLGTGINNNDLCPDCISELPWIEHACQHCGVPMVRPDTVCGKCMLDSPPFFQCIAPLVYATPVDRLIQGFKQGNLLFGHALAQAAAERISPVVIPDLLTPVPLHPAKRRSRGFNQALEITKVMSNHCGIPVRATLCQRVLDTPAQRLLDRQERQKNLQGAFTASATASGKHVGLVDDVVTTGATVSEVTDTLLQAGASMVTVLALARTPMHH